MTPASKSAARQAITISMRHLRRQAFREVKVVCLCSSLPEQLYCLLCGL